MDGMTSFLNLAMLVLTSMASLAFGILAAYGILRAGFALIRPREERVAMKPQAEAARTV